MTGALSRNTLRVKKEGGSRSSTPRPHRQSHGSSAATALSMAIQNAHSEFARTAEDRIHRLNSSIFKNQKQAARAVAAGIKMVYEAWLAAERADWEYRNGASDDTYPYYQPAYWEKLEKLLARCSAEADAAETAILTLQRQVDALPQGRDKDAMRELVKFSTGFKSNVSGVYTSIAGALKASAAFRGGSFGDYAQLNWLHGQLTPVPGLSRSTTDSSTNSSDQPQTPPSNSYFPQYSLPAPRMSRRNLERYRLSHEEWLHKNRHSLW